MQNVNQARAEIIAQARAHVAKLEEALENFTAPGVMRGEQFVVTCGGFPISYTFDSNGFVTSTKTGNSLALHMFSRAAAQTLANATRNGNGELGRVMHVTDYYEQAIEDQLTMIATLSK